MAKNTPKLTPMDRERVLGMAKANPGITATEISRTLGLNGQQVCGVISTARNRGLLPKRAAMPQEPRASARLDQKAENQILIMAKANKSPNDIARILKISVRSVFGFILWARDRGLLPAPKPAISGPAMPRPAWAGPVSATPPKRPTEAFPPEPYYRPWLEYSNPPYAQAAKLEELGRQIAAKDAQIDILIQLLARFVPVEYWSKRDAWPFRARKDSKRRRP